MTRRRIHVLTALILASALFACSQFGGMGGGRHGGGDRRSGQEARDERPLEVSRMSVNDEIRLRLSDLRVALNLTPEQAPLWQAYETRAIEFLSESERDARSPSGGNALSQIDRRLIAEQRHAAAMAQVADSARQVYSRLTDEQKRTADLKLAGTIPAEELGLAAAPRRGR
jgi:hypothetical protein